MEIKNSTFEFSHRRTISFKTTSTLEGTAMHRTVSVDGRAEMMFKKIKKYLAHWKNDFLRSLILLFFLLHIQFTPIPSKYYENFSLF